MPTVDVDEFQSYYSRIRPIFPLSINLAHLITGNTESSEYCVQCAILDCWVAGESSSSIHGFRESMRARTIRVAQKSIDPKAEFDWNGLNLSENDTSPIMIQLRKEPADNQRILALHYGCGFSPRRCALVCGIDTRKARSVIERFERRVNRKLPNTEKRKFDMIMPRVMREVLARPNAAMPKLSVVFRSFQADARETQRPSRLPARIARIIFAAILTILCVVGFFLAAVLMQPPAVEKPANQQITNTFTP